MNKVVLTGGPCSGKSEMAEVLKSRGYCIVPETALEIIYDEVKKEKPILPWTDMPLFMNKVIPRQIEKENELDGNQVFLLDRSLWDSKAYCSFYGIESPELDRALISSHYDLVLFLEMLPREFWNKTPSGKPRGQTYENGQKVHQKIYEIYQGTGIPLIKIPFLPIKERADIIESYLTKR